MRHRALCRRSGGLPRISQDRGRQRKVAPNWLGGCYFCFLVTKTHSFEADHRDLVHYRSLALQEKRFALAQFILSSRKNGVLQQISAVSFTFASILVFQLTTKMVFLPRCKAQQVAPRLRSSFATS
jgi:hypothetical protein